MAAPKSHRTSRIVVIQVIPNCPKSKLLPSDPVARARARHFIQIFETTFVSAFDAVIYAGASPAKVVVVPDTALGEWSLADVTAASLSR